MVHTESLRKAFATAGKTAWCYYAPFLCCFSLPPKREVYVERRENAFCILVRRGDRVDMVMPPLPFSNRVLRDIVRDLECINRERPTRILWVDESDARRLQRDGFELRHKDTEYLYDPEQVVRASGRQYRDLRKRLNRFGGKYDFGFRSMHHKDIPACHDLLIHWRKQQGRKRPFLLDWGYTKAALDRYGMWSPEDLQGWCLEIGDRLVGFAMAGAIQRNLANFFVAKADPGIYGASEMLRYKDRL